MIPHFKLLFDECVGAPVVGNLATLVESSPLKAELKHILSFQQSGVLDSVWIPQVAADGWIIVTADRGRRNKRESKEDKLPHLCRLHRITHILLSATIHQTSSFEKARAILAVWERLP